MKTVYNVKEQSLLDVFLGQNSTSVWRRVGLVIISSILLTVSAKIAIPFYPVPVTLQTLAVLLLGVVLGPRLSAMAVGLYVAEGAIGLPVFTGTPEKGIGLAYMMGPTGGYLAGFLVAAPVVGYLARAGFDRGFVSMALLMVVGNLVIYLFGLAWLGNLFGWDKPILAWGLYPFVLGDLLKIAIGTAAMPLIWSAIGSRR